MAEWQDWLVVIPARLGATRLPRKPLADLKGKPLVVRVYDRVAPLARHGATVLVATDHADVMAVLAQHGIPGVMTSADHPSGTDRVREAAASSNHPLIMNVQGDEPFIAVSDLERLATSCAATPSFEMGTLVYKSMNQSDYRTPSVVKCVRAANAHALYFSRSPLPCFRDGFDSAEGGEFWHHLGVYAFSRKTLDRFCTLPQGRLEQAEKLEQLRALENSIPILTVEAQHLSIGIDTPDDLRAAHARL